MDELNLHLQSLIQKICSHPPASHKHRQAVNSLLFRGHLAGINILVYGLIALLSSTTLTSIHRSATKSYQPILRLFLLISITATLLMGLFGVGQINHLFGMGSTDPLTPWFATTIFLTPLFFLLVRLIDLRVNNE